MKSRTSFFNGTALRKDITRFAPVWGLYSVFLLLMLLLQSRDSLHDALIETVSSGGGLTVINLIYAAICAALLFGDLFQSRMCNMLHAMPLRREGWFLIHVMAGLLFSFVPNLFYTAAALLLMGADHYLALVWLAIMSLEFLFFFGVGCFAALCAGNRFAMLTIYGIVNFLSELAYLLVNTIYRPLLYGITLRNASFRFFCPATHLGTNDFFEYFYVRILGEARMQIDTVNWSLWYYLFMAAALGLLFMGVALWLYRRRAMESAGDFIAFRPLAPVFLVIYTLSVGTLMFSIAELIADALEYVFLIIGLVVGFFTGRMLLDRTVKVFRPKVLLKFALLIATLFVSLGLLWMDPLGIINYVPKAQEIRSIQIYTLDMRLPYNHDRRGLVDTYRLTSKEDIETIRAMHQTILRDRTEESYDTPVLYLTYEMEDGTTVQRRYPVRADSDAGKTLKAYFSDWRYIFQTNAEWGELTSRIQHCVAQYESKVADLPALMEAVRADCEAGTFVQDWEFHRDEYFDCWLEFQYTTDNGEIATLELRVYPSCENVIRFLKEHGYYEEYQDYIIYD